MQRHVYNWTTRERSGLLAMALYLGVLALLLIAFAFGEFRNG